MPIYPNVQPGATQLLRYVINVAVVVVCPCISEPKPGHTVLSPLSCPWFCTADQAIRALSPGLAWVCPLFVRAPPKPTSVNVSPIWLPHAEFRQPLEVSHVFSKDRVTMCHGCSANQQVVRANWLTCGAKQGGKAGVDPGDPHIER